LQRTALRTRNRENASKVEKAMIYCISSRLLSVPTSLQHSKQTWQSDKKDTPRNPWWKLLQNSTTICTSLCFQRWLL